MAVAQLPPRWGTRTLPAVLRQLLGDGASPVRGLHAGTRQQSGTSYSVLGERREWPEPSAKPVSFPLFAPGVLKPPPPREEAAEGNSLCLVAMPGPLLWAELRGTAMGRAEG